MYFWSKSHMDTLRDFDRIGGWLYKTAGNISRRYAASLRKERAKFAVPSPAFGAGEGGETPVDGIGVEGNIQSEEERIAEEKALARTAREIERRLKPGDAQILELVFGKKYPLGEAAARLNITLSAMKSRTSRLRQKIHALVRELLADSGDEVSSSRRTSSVSSLFTK